MDVWTLPQGVSRSRLRLSIPVLGSYVERQAPLPGWRISGTGKKAGAARTPLRNAQVLAGPQVGWGEVFPDHLAVFPSLHGANVTTLISGKID